MMNTDVLVGSHGAALNNAQFMSPGSVVIDILPSNYVEFEWFNLLSSSEYLVPHL